MAKKIICLVKWFFLVIKEKFVLKRKMFTKTNVAWFKCQMKQIWLKTYKTSWKIFSAIPHPTSVFKIPKLKLGTSPNQHHESST